MITYQTLADRTDTAVPAHLDQQATPPVVTLGGRQGDVYVTATQAPAPRGARPINIATGHKVVEGDADRNSHILIGDGHFTPGTVTDRLVDYGLLEVPDGGVAHLIHTSEHGAIGFAPGRYRVFGQRSFETELRRAAD